MNIFSKIKSSAIRNAVMARINPKIEEAELAYTEGESKINNDYLQVMQTAAQNRDAQKSSLQETLINQVVS